MKSKPIAHYFETARQLPIAMSMDQVRLIVSTNGIPPKPSRWWNLNNFLIMTSLITIIGAVFYLNMPTINHKDAIYQPIELKQMEQSITVEDFSFKNSTSDDNATITIFTEDKQTLKIDSQKATIQAFENQSFSKIDSDQIIMNVFPIEEIEEILEMEKATEMTEDVEESSFDQVTNLKGESKEDVKSIIAAAIDVLKISTSNAPIIINTWDKNEIEVTAIFTLEAKKYEDTKLGLEDFKLDLVREGNLITAITNWDEIENCNCGSKRKNKIKTDNGASIEFEQFTIAYEVKVPKDINLNLTNKYNNIVIPSINGGVKANGFKGNISIGDVTGSIDLDSKYGNVTLGNYADGTINVFKGAVSGKSGQTLTIKANYSSVKLADIKNLKINAFKSSAELSGNIVQLEGSVKYGSLKVAGDVDQLDLAVFKSSVQINNSKVSKLDLSYSDFKAKDIDQLDISKAFKSNIQLNNSIEIQGNFQYSPISIKHIGRSIDISSFKGDISVGEVGKDFTKVKVMSKYDNINMQLNPKSAYTIETESSYSQINLPTGIENNHNEEIDSINHHFVGVQNNSGSTKLSSVYFNLFKVNLSLR